MSWNDHDHRGEYADARHEHYGDYAEVRHEHWDLQRADDSLRGELRDLRAEVGEMRGLLELASDRIRQLEAAAADAPTGCEKSR